MKRILVIVSLLVFSCSTTPNYYSFDNALEMGTEKIQKDLPAGTEVAILDFKSDNENLSAYVIEEMYDKLINFGKLSIMERSRTNTIAMETGYQFSGEVDDSEIIAIGHQLGADYVVTGQIIYSGEAYRLRIFAIDIAKGRRVASSSLNINPDDRQINYLLTTKTVGKAPVAETTPPPLPIWKPEPPNMGNVYREEGNASWYGEEFSGRPTASGEIFNPTLFTAAHPTLPFGTFLFVTNKNNNRQVTVKVNDRGPFVASRIIDLSKAAAEHLDMLDSGIAPVIIEILASSYSQQPPPPFVPEPYTGPGDPPISFSLYTAPPVDIDNMRIIPGLPSPYSGKTYRLLVGTYPGVDSAYHVNRQLECASFRVVQEQAGNMCRVFVGGIPASSVYAAVQRLGAIGFAEVWVQE
jgi:rare lipoprotein A